MRIVKENKMFPVYDWKKNGYKLWLIGILLVFLFNWKWALILTAGYTSYVVSLGLIAWWVDSRAKTEQDDFL